MLTSVGGAILVQRVLTRTVRCVLSRLANRVRDLRLNHLCSPVTYISSKVMDGYSEQEATDMWVESMEGEANGCNCD